MTENSLLRACHLMASSTVDSSVSDIFSTAPALQSNIGILSPDQIELAKILLESDQTHLFMHWSEPGDDGLRFDR
ncbi:hypothetical protein Bca4012_019047 [Brassica carinata]